MANWCLWTFVVSMLLSSSHADVAAGSAHNSGATRHSGAAAQDPKPPLLCTLRLRWSNLFRDLKQKESELLSDVHQAVYSALDAGVIARLQVAGDRAVTVPVALGPLHPLQSPLPQDHFDFDVPDIYASFSIPADAFSGDDDRNAGIVVHLVGPSAIRWAPNHVTVRRHPSTLQCSSHTPNTSAGDTLDSDDEATYRMPSFEISGFRFTGRTSIRYVPTAAAQADPHLTLHIASKDQHVSAAVRPDGTFELSDAITLGQYDVFAGAGQHKRPVWSVTVGAKAALALLKGANSLPEINMGVGVVNGRLSFDGIGLGSAQLIGVAADGSEHTTTTDANGHFSFDFVPCGSMTIYHVSVNERVRLGSGSDVAVCQPTPVLLQLSVPRLHIRGTVVAGGTNTNANANANADESRRVSGVQLYMDGAQVAVSGTDGNFAFDITAAVATTAAGGDRHSQPSRESKLEAKSASHNFDPVALADAIAHHNNLILRVRSYRVCGRVGIGENLVGVMYIGFRYVRLFRYDGAPWWLSSPPPSSSSNNAPKGATVPAFARHLPFADNAAVTPFWSFPASELIPAAADAAAPAQRYSFGLADEGGNHNTQLPAGVPYRNLVRIFSVIAKAAGRVFGALWWVLQHTLFVPIWSFAGSMITTAANHSHMLWKHFPITLSQVTTHGARGLAPVDGNEYSHATTPASADAAAYRDTLNWLFNSYDPVGHANHIGEFAGYLLTEIDGSFCFPEVEPGQYFLLPGMSVAETNYIGLMPSPLGYRLDLGQPTSDLSSPTNTVHLSGLHFTINWPSVQGEVDFAAGVLMPGDAFKVALRPLPSLQAKRVRDSLPYVFPEPFAGNVSLIPGDAGRQGTGSTSHHRCFQNAFRNLMQAGNGPSSQRAQFPFISTSGLPLSPNSFHESVVHCLAQDKGSVPVGGHSTLSGNILYESLLPADGKLSFAFDGLLPGYYEVAVSSSSNAMFALCGDLRRVIHVVPGITVDALTFSITGRKHVVSIDGSTADAACYTTGTTYRPPAHMRLAAVGAEGKLQPFAEAVLDFAEKTAKLDSGVSVPFPLKATVQHIKLHGRIIAFVPPEELSATTPPFQQSASSSFAMQGIERLGHRLMMYGQLQEVDFGYYVWVPVGEEGSVSLASGVKDGLLPFNEYRVRVDVPDGQLALAKCRASISGTVTTDKVVHYSTLDACLPPFLITRTITLSGNITHHDGAAFTLSADPSASRWPFYDLFGVRQQSGSGGSYSLDVPVLPASDSVAMISANVARQAGWLLSVSHNRATADAASGAHLVYLVEWDSSLRPHFHLRSTVSLTLRFAASILDGMVEEVMVNVTSVPYSTGDRLMHVGGLAVLAPGSMDFVLPSRLPPGAYFAHLWSPRLQFAVPTGGAVSHVATNGPAATIAFATEGIAPITVNVNASATGYRCFVGRVRCFAASEQCVHPISVSIRSGGTAVWHGQTDVADSYHACFSPLAAGGPYRIDVAFDNGQVSVPWDSASPLPEVAAFPTPAATAMRSLSSFHDSIDSVRQFVVSGVGFLGKLLTVVVIVSASFMFFARDQLSHFTTDSPTKATADKAAALAAATSNGGPDNSEALPNIAVVHHSSGNGATKRQAHRRR